MQSTRLPDAWIDLLLDRMAAMYGSAFTAKWQTTDPHAMRDLWATSLGPYSGPQIKWALENLVRSGDGFPPSLPVFVGLCRQAPRPEPKSLPAPAIEAAEAKKRKQQAEQTAAEILSKPKDYKKWAKDLREMYLAGKSLEPLQVQFASAALGEEWAGGECKRSAMA